MSQSPIFPHYFARLLLILLLALVFSAAGAPHAHAQTETPVPATPTATATTPPAGAPQPTAVQPNSVSSANDTELGNTGSNLVNGAVVVTKAPSPCRTTTAPVTKLLPVITSWRSLGMLTLVG